MKSALVIGISGQDGGYLAQALLAEGRAVHGTSRDHRAASFAGLERLGIRERITLSSLEPADFAATKAFLERTPVDEIYNLSGQSSVATSFVDPRGTFESIATATLNVLECLRLLRTPARYYSAGSSEMFGDTPKPADEATPPRPLSPYGLAKAAAHHAVTHYREVHGIYATTGILFNHESPLRGLEFVTRKITDGAAKIKLGKLDCIELGNLDARRDWGYAKEYVEGMHRMLQAPEPETYVLATGRRPAEVDLLIGDPARAREKLGWAATTTLEELCRMMVEADLRRNRSGGSIF